VLDAFAERIVFDRMRALLCLIDPAVASERAIAAYAKAGLDHLFTVWGGPGGEARLMVRHPGAGIG